MNCLEIAGGVGGDEAAGTVGRREEEGRGRGGHYRRSGAVHAEVRGAHGGKKMDRRRAPGEPGAREAHAAHEMIQVTAGDGGRG